MREVNARAVAVLGFPIGQVEEVQFTFQITVADPEQLEEEIRSVYAGPVAVYADRETKLDDSGASYSIAAVGYRVIVPRDLTTDEQQAIAAVIAGHKPEPRFVLSDAEKQGAMELAANPSISAQKLQDAARMLSAALLRAQRIEAKG